MGTTHSNAAQKFLADIEKSEWHDQTLWGVRMKRDFQAKGQEDWEMLRDRASEIKSHTLRNLDAYLEEFVERATGNGIVVHRVKDALEFNETVLNILKVRGVRKLVKSKSMLTEECGMPPFLEDNGIDVVETDLGEYIIQQMKMRPSHIVMPAIHLTKEDVGKLFVARLGSEEGNNDPTYLTHCARKHLRKEFMTADAGMTGVNFAIAGTGEIVVCTNEGNADLCASVPKLHRSWVWKK